MQALHAYCHAQRTSEQAANFDDDPLLSHMNPHVFQQYNESPTIPPLGWQFKNLNQAKCAYIADVIRCRTRCLSNTDLPVLSPFDEIQAIEDQQLGDLAYVALPYKSFVSQLGYS